MKISLLVLIAIGMGVVNSAPTTNGTAVKASMPPPTTNGPSMKPVTTKNPAIKVPLPLLTTNCGALKKSISPANLRELCDKLLSMEALTRNMWDSVKTPQCSATKNGGISKDNFLYTSNKIKYTDYEILVFARALFREEGSRMRKAFATNFMKKSAVLKEPTEKLLLQYCDINGWFNEIIEGYEEQCSYYQTKPNIDMTKYFYPFDLSLNINNMPDCLTPKENTIENQALIVIMQSSELARSFWFAVDFKLTVEHKQSSCSRSSYKKKLMTSSS